MTDFNADIFLVFSLFSLLLWIFRYYYKCVCDKDAARTEKEERCVFTAPSF